MDSDFLTENWLQWCQKATDADLTKELARQRTNSIGYTVVKEEIQKRKEGLKR